MPAVGFQHSFANGFEGWEANGLELHQVQWRGRQALVLGNGPALAPFQPEAPFSIRASVSGGPEECYVGVCFHAADRGNHETIYLAPQAGAHMTAIQYDPVIKGSNTWQVFGDADGLAKAPLPSPLRKEHWHILRTDIWPDIAQVFIDGASSPAATFPLRSGLREGRVGLWGYLPCYASDFQVLPLAYPAPPHPEPKVTVPPGTVRQWLVRLDDQRSRNVIRPRVVATEHNGTLCLNRLSRSKPDIRALAACEVEVPPGAEGARLETGYSDRARIWWDGVFVHEGEWEWKPAAGADGRVRPGQVTVPLPVEPGRHTLLMEVTTTEPPFGWGLTARVLAGGAPCAWKPASKSGLPKGNRNKSGLQESSVSPV